MDQPLELHLAGQVEHPPGFWHEVRARAVTDHVPVATPSTVADLGAGGGQLGRILARDRPLARYRFHEPLEALNERLVATHGEDARLSPDEALDVDVVALLDVVEHVEHDRAFVAGVVAACRPGATIVITVPALPALWSSWDEALGHFRRYTRASLVAVVDPLPVDVLEVSYLFPELLVPAVLRKGWRALRGARHGAAVDFVQLPRPVDRVARAIGATSFRLRHRMPLGTSVLLVLRVRPSG